MTQIYVRKLTIFGSDNGLSPGRCQAIIWTKAGILLILNLGTNFSEILSEIHELSFKNTHPKISSAKWRQFCLGLNVLYILLTHSSVSAMTYEKCNSVQSIPWIKLDAQISVGPKEGQNNTFLLCYKIDLSCLLASGRCGSNFTSVTKNDNLGTRNEIALRWMAQKLTNEKSPLVEVMAWCSQAWSKVDPDLCRHMAPQSHHELTWELRF